MKTAPKSVIELHVEANRRDARMRSFVDRARDSGIKIVETDGERLDKMAGSSRHQGVVARVEVIEMPHSLDEVVEDIEGPPLLLVLDGVTDPHNLGACLRVADGAGAHAVVAPKDHAVGVNATVAKVASGAAETVPYIMVTNLARTLNELKDFDIRIIGTSDDAEQDAVRPRPHRPRRLRAGQRGRRHAPADAQDLRPAGAHPDGRRRREPERVGRRGRVPVRGAAPAQQGRRLNFSRLG